MQKIAANNFDLFHPTFYHDYFLKSLKKPFIITVHDLTSFKFSDSFHEKEAVNQKMETVIKKANRIIAVSENTKIDIIETFNINPDIIDVIYHGFNANGTSPNANQHGQYILFVGNRNGYKNFKTFISGVSILLQQERDLKVVCVGKPFSKFEIEHFKRLNMLEQISVINVDEAGLNNLYANALVFVYPSLYEGFGMPILEAFANNCSICLSNASCFPEIAGDAGIYFDPNKEESILEAVQKVVYNREFALSKIKKGKERLLNFSWKKTAEETIVSYKKSV
jgi:glycosyltransferase involved in cell wall biosynthesis